MDDIRKLIQGKKVTVMGLGLLGGALNDTIFLAEHGADLIVTDLKTEAELATSIEKLKQFPDIKFSLGGHVLEDFRDRDFIVQPGNVPPDSPFLLEAQKHNIPIYVSESFFAEHTKATLVGITGTRGKSTTTQMIFDILEKHAPEGRHVFLGGNVKNTSTMALLKKALEGDIVVLELDSWALHGMGDVKKSPHVAVFTTFFDDHLNFYKGDRNLYFEDKAQIFKHQSTSDYLIVGEQAEAIVMATYGDRIVSNIIVAKKLPENIQLHVIGQHNRYNAACAYEALTVLGLREEDIIKGLEEFKGIAGRLQHIGEKDGVKIYNDTNATTPDATITALRALDNGHQRIILIAGGADKGLDMKACLAVIKETTQQVILLEGTGTERIKHDLPRAPVYDSLVDAVTDAFQVAKNGDIILFSPGFASFGMFKNEYDRGEQFEQIINTQVSHESKSI